MNDPSRKVRGHWSPELHEHFVRVVHHHGPGKVEMISTYNFKYNFIYQIDVFLFTLN